MHGALTGSGSEAGNTRPAGAGAARLAYGVVHVLLARRLARSLVAGPGVSSRWLIRGAGLRHLVQSAATALDSQAARTRHEHEVEMQNVVQELVATCDGRPVDQVMSRLLEAVTARHLGPYPRTWLEAIARDAAARRTYVVTKVAAEKAGIPEPLPGPPTAGVT